MGFWGAVIMSIAGTIFFMVTINVLASAHIGLLSLPVLILAAFLVYAFRIRRRLTNLRTLTKKASNVVTWSSAGEGIGILIAINVVKNIGHPEWIIPAVAFVVGLHFLPMAFALPFKPFYALGGLLMLGAVAGACLPYLPGATVAGLTAGLCLWIAAVLAIRRELRWSEAVVVGS